MSARFYLELAGGVLLLVFGLLFLRYLPINFSEVTTIVIFVGAGILVIRKAILDWTQAKINEELEKKNQNRNTATKPGPKKVRY